MATRVPIAFGRLDIHDKFYSNRISNIVSIKDSEFTSHTVGEWNFRHSLSPSTTVYIEQTTETTAEVVNRENKYICYYCGNRYDKFHIWTSVLIKPEVGNKAWWLDQCENCLEKTYNDMVALRDLSKKDNSNG